MTMTMTDSQRAKADARLVRMATDAGMPLDEATFEDVKTDMDDPAIPVGRRVIVPHGAPEADGFRRWFVREVICLPKAYRRGMSRH